jgi:hypothetical protein
MRRGATVLVVVVVAAIALAAGFDALRGDEGSQPPVDTGPEPPSTSTAETPEAPASEQERFAGVLYYTDESCQLRAVQLPDLEPAEAPNWDECRFVLSPDGRRVSGVGSDWDPHSDPRRGRLFQSADGSIQVSTNGGPEGEHVEGEAPAWRPDGTLTYFADGAIREWPSGRVVISADKLRSAAMTHVNAPGDPSLVRRLQARHVAWLDQDRAVVAIHGASWGGADVELAAVFERGRRLAVFSTLAPITDLWTSPRGEFWAIAADGLQLFQGNRDTLPLPQLVDPVAVTWSPDETHMAVATRASVLVFPPGETDSVRRLPLVAADLAWRGEAGPPSLVDADEVRDWLGGVGGTGRLFVSLPGCRLRALRLPDLLWEEEPNVPAPCRFTLTPADAPLDEAISVSPTGELRASCEGGGLRIFDNGGFRAQLPGACSPAWMGDGTLTFVRNGGLWRGIEDARRLVSREQISEMFGRPSALVEVAWVDDERFWAVVRSGESAIVAHLTTERLVFSPSFTTREIEGLRVSATGMVAARTDQGVVFFDSGGRRALTFPNGRAVAWAPGELYAAVATPNEVLFVAPVSREVVPISLEVSDLEWVVP